MGVAMYVNLSGVCCLSNVASSSGVQSGVATTTGRGGKDAPSPVYMGVFSRVSGMF